MTVIRDPVNLFSDSRNKNSINPTHYINEGCGLQLRELISEIGGRLVGLSVCQGPPTPVSSVQFNKLRSTVPAALDHCFQM